MATSMAVQIISQCKAFGAETTAIWFVVRYSMATMQPDLLVTGGCYGTLKEHAGRLTCNAFVS